MTGGTYDITAGTVGISLYCLPEVEYTALKTLKAGASAGVNLLSIGATTSTKPAKLTTG